MTDEETRETIAELTNMPVEIEAIVRKFNKLYDEKCPQIYGLVKNCDNSCMKCWLEALRHE